MGAWFGECFSCLSGWLGRSDAASLSKAPLLRNHDLPGRLGDPSMTLMTEPRMDKAFLKKLKPDLICGRYGPVGKALPCPLSETSSLWKQYTYIRFLDRYVLPDMISKPISRELEKIDRSDISEAVHTIGGSNNNSIDICCARPRSALGPLPAVLWIHGGGMAMMDAKCPFYEMKRVQLAKKGFHVFFPDFRNSAYNNPYPAGLDDCMSSLAWLHENRERLNISKIVVCGESGGGNLALSMAIRAKRERKLHQLDGVFACCPFIAGMEAWRTKKFQSLLECDGYFIDMAIFRICASLYDPDGSHSKDPCAWPLMATKADLKGLPPHVISVNELDPLRDEGLEYVNYLKDASVRVSSRIVKGTQHAGDLLSKHIPGGERHEEETDNALWEFAASL